MTYPQIFLILLESRLLREKEGSSLLVHAPITLLFPHFSVFLHFLSYSYVPSFLPYFLFLFFLAIFLTCFSLLFLIASPSFSLLFSLCTSNAFLYYLPWWVLLFYPSIIDSGDVRKLLFNIIYVCKSIVFLCFRS